MPKQETTSFESIMSDIKARTFAPIYVLMGEESYFIDRICEALSTSILPEEEREFNQFVVYGIDVSDKQIAEMAREYPMMSEYKVVIVKEAQNIRSTEELEKYLDHPSPQTILIYCYKNGKIDARKKFLSKAKALGVVFESKRVSDRDLPGFVEEFVKVRGKSIDHRTAAIIAESIGSDLCRLATELDKLCLSMPESEQQVTPLLVEEVVGVSREYNPFKLQEAIVKKDFVKANRIANYFDKNPKSGGVYVLLPTIFNYFQNLMIAWYAPNRRNPRELAQHLELRGDWQVRDYEEGMRNYSAQKTMQIISKIRETDEKVKGLNSTGSTSNGDLMKELLFFIFH